jgi:hypothetical protein
MKPALIFHLTMFCLMDDSVRSCKYLRCFAQRPFWLQIGFGVVHAGLSSPLSTHNCDASSFSLQSAEAIGRMIHQGFYELDRELREIPQFVGTFDFAFDQFLNMLALCCLLTLPWRSSCLFLSTSFCNILFDAD